MEEQTRADLKIRWFFFISSSIYLDKVTKLLREINWTEEFRDLTAELV